MRNRRWSPPSALSQAVVFGATVKPVLGTATTSAVYVAAMQTADWGAPLGPGDNLTVRIYQLSAFVGLGALTCPRFQGHS